MTADELIRNKLNQSTNLSPLEIVKIIQDITAFNLERCIKGYFHYKNDYIHKLKDIKPHENLLTSSELSRVAFLDLRIIKHTTEEKNRL